MTRLTDQEIEQIARRIAADMGRVAAEQPPAVQAQATGVGVFATVSDAVSAAAIAQNEFVALKLEHRARILEAMRQSMRENGAMLAKAAFDETGFGRYEDKIVKNRLVTDKTPGLEDLAPIATTGDSGLALVEPAPFGDLRAVTPVTTPTSTTICNCTVL